MLLRRRRGKRQGEYFVFGGRTRTRSELVAIVARDFDGDTIEMVENHAMSRITNEIPSTMRVRVSARTLESILDQFAPKKVDLLSLDVEGFEPQVLDGLNLKRWQPDHILCECLSQSAFKEVEARIGPYYELVAQPTYRDFFFRKRNEDYLVPKFVGTKVNSN